jgi:hypothetical protein
MVDWGCFGIFQSSIDWSRLEKLSSSLRLGSEEEEEEVDFLRERRKDT